MHAKSFAILMCVAIGAASTTDFAAAQDAPKSTANGTSGSAQRVAEASAKQQRTAEIEKLVTQLGNEKFDVREEADEKLSEFGDLARSALEHALESPDPEIVARARRILASVPARTHTVVDALGAPMPNAFVAITIITQNNGEVIVQKRLLAESDDQGRIPIPPLTSADQKAVVEIHQLEYGSGRYEVGSRAREKELRFPLVRAGTEARARAVEGVVQGIDGRPIVGAIVRCQNVRTPGRGLINAAEPFGTAMTDQDGRFVYYLPNQNRRGERGDLIPVNSNYQLNVSAPDDESFLPTGGMFSNLAPNVIQLNRATQYHRFRFEAAAGGWIDDPKQLSAIFVQFEGDAAIKQPRIVLENSAVSQGRKLALGKYSAVGYFGGDQVKYQPIDVRQDSPEELHFLLPSAQVFRGRVVNGITGTPIGGAYVMGYASTSHNNLAMLSAEAWGQLPEIAANPTFDFKAENPLRQQYGVLALVRTADNGEFEITQRRDKKFYGLIAFAADYVPFNVRGISLKIDGPGPVAAGEFPLFPAAKVLVRPVHAGDRLAVSPKWLLEESMQPEWIERFRTASDGQNREFEYVHWLEINTSQPLYVPAGVRLRLKFESPYDDAWAPAVLETPIQLKPGVTHEIGDIHFAAGLAATVRVIDQSGKPLEGIPVRRRYDEGPGSVAHNTDALGQAYFHLNPRSRGRFYIYDFPSPREQAKAENLFAKFEVADTAPAQSFEITLTAEQKRLLLEKSSLQR